MAVFNVPNYLAKDGFGMSLNIRRGNPNPLDNSSVWASLAEAQNYAKTDPVAYVGQILTVVTDVVVDEVTVKTATAYVIDNEAGDLKEVGSSPVGDEKSITVAEDGTVSLYGIAGLALTREEEDGSTTNITYQPLLVNGKLTWVEPSATTVEGLATEIEGLKTRISALENAVGKAAEGETEATGLVKDVADLGARLTTAEDAIDDIAVIINGREAAEGVEAVTGLTALIAENAQGISDINDKIGTVEDGKTIVELIAEAEGKIPTNISAFTNDSKYQTDTQVQATVEAAIAGINHAVFEKVEQIPEASAATDNVLYLVPGTDGTHHDIYAKINGTMVLIDDTDADLSGYAKLSDLHEHTNKEVIDAITSARVTAWDAAEQNAKDHADGLNTAMDTRVAGLEAVGAEKNVIATVDTTQFTIDGNRNLTLLDVAMSKVTGLTDALAGKVDKVEGSRLLTEDEATKLEKLVLGDNGEVSVSGKVAAGNVDGLDAWITARAGTLTGLSENNLTDALVEKINGVEAGAQVNKIESVTLGGTAITISNKTVDIPVAAMEALGLVKSSDAENKISVAADGTMEVNSINVNKLVQTDGDTLILNGGSAK